MLSDPAILKKIGQQPKRSAGYKQLARELGLRGEQRHELNDRLDRLVSSGKLVKVDSDRYALPANVPGKNMIVGRLSMHRDGYGFVLPDPKSVGDRFKGLAGDIFIPPPFIGNAMHGDQVLIEVGTIRPDGRAEGRIIRPVNRAHTTVVGTFHYGSRYNYVTPIDEKIRQEIVIPPGMEHPQEARVPKIASTTVPQVRVRSEDANLGSCAKSKNVDRVLGDEAARRTKSDDLAGVIVDVEITDWPSPTQNPRGKVVEILGYEDDFGVDVEIMIRKHHLPHRFPAEVLDAAQSVENEIPARELHKRRDYRGLPIVTIDGETARDFDDAVHVRQLDNGNYELQVHIADVAQYVTDSSALDQEARLRGTSVYFPDRAVPMLPLELSTDICSLRPKVARLVLSCMMEIDHRGDVLGYEICEGVIRSAERMTYTAVNAILEGDAQLRQQYSALVPHFERMRDLALILNRKRVRRGSIDFDLPEPVIEFDENGLMNSITRSERNIANRRSKSSCWRPTRALHITSPPHRVALPHSREARCQACVRLRNHRGHIRIFAGCRRAAHPARATQNGPPRRPRQRPQCARNRNSERSSHHAAHVPEAHGEDRGQAGRTDPELPDVALAQAGALLRSERRPLRAGGDDLHALHLAHPPLSRFDCAPDSEGCVGRGSGEMGGRHSRGSVDRF
jgi:ribonuclease R